MAQPAKPQWDFGELFPAEPKRQVLSVWELTSNIKRLLEKQVGLVWVGGEITNLRRQGSGHVYFTLKDAAAQLSCVLFRSGAPGVRREALADGLKVELHGEVTVYEARGQYQLIVRSLELQGVGALQQAFERLKQKLAGLGWFAPERKRALPRYPRRLGLVTSPTGAAIRDVLHVIARRHPGLEIVMAPCRVQGEGAAGEIASAIRSLNEFSANSGEPLDLLLITRGGGSLEDLWAFNEEVVAQAIFESALPVVSAVGHEIDFSIADFVADLRAATPSAAAELITEGYFASRERVVELPGRLRQLVARRLHLAVQQIESVAGRLARRHPRRAVNEAWQRWDDGQTGLVRALKAGVRTRQQTLTGLAGRFARGHPAHAVRTRRELLRQLERRLQSLGPEQVLARGYSITRAADTGAVIRSAAEVSPGQKLRTRLKHGEITSRVDK